MGVIIVEHSAVTSASTHSMKDKDNNHDKSLLLFENDEIKASAATSTGKNDAFKLQ